MLIGEGARDSGAVGLKGVRAVLRCFWPMSTCSAPDIGSETTCLSDSPMFVGSSRAAGDFLDKAIAPSAGEVATGESVGAEAMASSSIVVGPCFCSSFTGSSSTALAGSGAVEDGIEPDR